MYTGTIQEEERQRGHSEHTLLLEIQKANITKA